MPARVGGTLLDVSHPARGLFIGSTRCQFVAQGAVKIWESAALPARVGIFASASGSDDAVNGPFTPAANSRLFLLTQARRGSSLAINAPVTTDSLGSTWVNRGDAYNVVGATRVRLTLWELAIGASPVPMTVTTDYGTVSACGSTIIQVAGFAGAVTNVCKQETNILGSGALAFGVAPAATSLVFGAMLAQGTVPWAGVPSGGDWAELYNYNLTASPQQLQVVFDQASASNAAAWSSANSACAGLGWEVPL